MKLAEEQRDFLKNKVKELNDNVRHITQLGMGWFAFFVTINYLTMGWLAKAPASGRESIDSRVILIIAGVFILQNGLGIAGIVKVYRAAKALAGQVKTYEGWLLEVDAEVDTEALKASSVPVCLYKSIARSLVMVLSLLIPAWLGISLLLFLSS